MMQLHPRQLLSRSLTFLVWAAAAASAVIWGLKLSSKSDSGPMAAMAAATVQQADPSLIGKALGASKVEPSAAPQAPAVASRFALVGMLAGTQSHGVALISVDGKPAKPVRVGGRLEEGLVLQSVKARKASVGSSMDTPALFELEMPLVRPSSS